MGDISEGSIVVDRFYSIRINLPRSMITVYTQALNIWTISPLKMRATRTTLRYLVYLSNMMAANTQLARRSVL